jgi:hypothetical protein
MLLTILIFLLNRGHRWKTGRQLPIITGYIRSYYLHPPFYRLAVHFFSTVSPFCHSTVLPSNHILFIFSFVKVLPAGFTKLHLSLMRLWTQAMTFADTRVEKGQAEYTKPAKKNLRNQRNQRLKILRDPS